MSTQSTNVAKRRIHTQQNRFAVYWFYLWYIIFSKKPIPIVATVPQRAFTFCSRNGKENCLFDLFEITYA